MSGLTFEETGHKLMKIELQPGQEFEVASMILECCSQEKSFSKWVSPCLSVRPHASRLLGRKKARSLSWTHFQTALSSNKQRDEVLGSIARH